MANTKKYVSFDKLGVYDELLKAKIAADDKTTLDAAKAYADSLETNYDAAGSAAGVQAKLDEEIARAKAAEQVNADAAAAAQSTANEVKTYVGTIPSTASATDIVGYVQEKTSGIATDTALAELTGRVAQAETDIDNIEKDYLKAADKTELNEAISAEAARADAAEKVNAAAIKAIADDYLKGADKTELQGDIDTVSEGLAAVKEDVDAFFAAADMSENAKDTLKELQEYIASDETGAAAMAASIKQNSDDIDALEVRMEAAEGKITTAEGKITANEEAISALQASVGEGGSVDSKIEEAVSAETTARETAIAEVQADADKGIADAKAALEAAQAASAHADELNTNMDARVKVVEAKAHEHGNKSELDLIQTGDVAKWNSAQSNAETTAATNLAAAVSTLEGKITAAETAAKGHADTLNTNMDTRVSNLESWHTNFTEVSEEEINSLFSA